MTRAAILTLCFALAACGGAEQRQSVTLYAGAPVVIISIDTLRADHLPVYGYRGVTTPAIDAFRNDAILYRNAWSHCPMTLPSHVSLLTGLLPYEHGVRNNIGYSLDAARHDTIPAMLRRRGYSTGAAVSAYVMRKETGLGDLFDFYDDRTSGQENVAAGHVSRSGGETLAAAGPWLAGHSSRPFFFLLHLFEPHAPYDAPEPYRSRAAHPYDAEIAAVDALVGQFLDQLKSSGAYDRSIIILLSDHGEGLGDHGEGEHGVFLYREALHVPLLIKLPRNERGGSSVDAPVQLIDVAPTVAALTGAASSSEQAGLSLVGELPRDRRIYSETVLPRIHFGWSDLRSLAGERHHFIDAPRPELYDYVADPAEKKNIAGDERRLFAALQRDMEPHRTAFTSPSAIDPEEAGKLAALGYIGQARAGDDETSMPDPKDVIGQLEELRRISTIESGDLAAAAKLYGALARQNPRFADAWLRLATVQERLNQREAAIDSYRRALGAAPALASHLAIRIGSLYLEEGRLDDAAAHANLAVRTSPGAAHHLLGRVALARRDFTTADSEARLALSDPAYRGPAAILQALILVEQGRLQPALEILDRLKGESGQTTSVRDLEFTRGDILARLERAADAEAAFEAEIRAFPQNRDAYSRLAFLHFATGRRERGAGVLERMYAASPDAATAAMAAAVTEAVGETSLARVWRGRHRHGETLPTPARPNG